MVSARPAARLIYPQMDVRSCQFVLFSRLELISIEDKEQKTKPADYSKKVSSDLSHTIAS